FSLLPPSLAFPYTTLFRSCRQAAPQIGFAWLGFGMTPENEVHQASNFMALADRGRPADPAIPVAPRSRDRAPSVSGADSCRPRQDRKSTRLNSSHQIISYA